MRVLICWIGTIACLSSASTADVPSRLYAVAHLKGIISDLRRSLEDFKRNMTQELTKLEEREESYRKDKANESACLEKSLSHAHNETRKLLRMLVDGEVNQLNTAERSLENMTLGELSRLWGVLADGGESVKKMEKEMLNFRKTSSARIIEGRKTCHIERS